MSIDLTSKINLLMLSPRQQLVHASEGAAAREFQKARTQIQMFLLKNGFHYAAKPWRYRDRVWLADRPFEHMGQAGEAVADGIGHGRLLEIRVSCAIPVQVLAPL